MSDTHGFDKSRLPAKPVLVPLADGRFDFYCGSTYWRVDREYLERFLTDLCAAVAVDGAGLIAAERRRQVSGDGHGEGYSVERDVGYTNDELLMAAVTYIGSACSDASPIMWCIAAGETWPWHASTFKPADRKRDLIRAGALIAAELDRMLAAEQAHG